MHQDVVVAREAIDDAVCGAFNTWFSLFISLLEEVREAQCLDSAIEDDDRVYHTR
ncbi:hypothetical protein NC651_008102 [Populus alba x Populus x berolinensis]|nr:hypothetical protein NC651_008102 [Populus alba x Populus x berolinensis]